MRGILQPSMTWNKPPPTAEFIDTHPLQSAMSGAYLLNDGAFGRFGNYIAHNHSPVSAGASTDLVSGAAGFNGGRPCERGIGVRFDGTGYLTAGNPTQSYAATAGTFGFSWLIKFRINTLPGGAAGIWSNGVSATDGAPSVLLQCNGSTNIRVLTGNTAYQVLVTSPVAGVWYTIVGTTNAPIIPGNSVTETYYLGIGASRTQIYSGSVTANAGSSLVGTSIYLASGFNAALAMDCELLYFYDRELKYCEALDLILDPCQMLDYSRVIVPKSAATNPLYFGLRVNQAVKRAATF